MVMERCTTIDCRSMDTEESVEKQVNLEIDSHDRQLTIQQYDQLLQSLPNGVVLISKERTIVHINAQLEKMFGYRKEELLEKNIEILMPKRFHARHRKHVADYVANPRVRSMGSGLELFGLRKDGTEFPIDISLSYLTRDGEVFPLAVVRDITEQKNAEHKIALNYQIQKTISSVLKISLEPISLEEQLSHVLDLILTIPGFAMHARGSIYLVAKDKDQKTLELKAMHGFSVAQVDSCKTVSLEKGLTAVQATSCQIITADCLEVPHDIQYAVSNFAGQYCIPIVFGERTLGMVNVAVTGEHRRIPEEEEFLAAIANSLAGLIERHDSEMEKNRLREQLHESEKLAALGRITANVSHTIKNPLMAIGGFANRLVDKLPEGTKEKKYAGLIFTEAVRLENVLQNVLLFSRRDANRREECNVHEIIERALMMYEDICREKSIVISSHFADVPAVFGNKEQILQAVENILSNAIDAMPQGGTLTVGIKEEQQREISYVAINVQDTGHGIEAENINRIFEPFFTTKLLLKGTGLGLSITKKVVEEHDGFIRVDSKIGIGTTFSLLLPPHSHA
jgi:PAS domain S-box-containing protein